VADGRGNKKVTNSLVALSSAAVMAVYGAGYARTRAAADRFAQQATDRRARIPAPRDETPRSAQALARTAETPAAPAAPIAEPDAAPPEARVGASGSSQPLTPRFVAPSPRAASTANVVTPVAPPAPIATPTPVAEAQPATTATTSSLASPTAAQAASPAPAPVPASTQAPAPIPAPAPTPAPAPQNAAFKDGTYYGWGSCRHGDIQAAVVVEAGKIVEARVERCLTRYSCNWVTPIPPRILAKQGTTYDYVSGATESSDAFQDAVAEALSQAKP